jgi:hypothetical protein
VKGARQVGTGGKGWYVTGCDVMDKGETRGLILERRSRVGFLRLVVRERDEMIGMGWDVIDTFKDSNLAAVRQWGTCCGWLIMIERVS